MEYCGKNSATETKISPERRRGFLLSGENGEVKRNKWVSERNPGICLLVPGAFYFAMRLATISSAGRVGIGEPLGLFMPSGILVSTLNLISLAEIVPV